MCYSSEDLLCITPFFSSSPLHRQPHCMYSLTVGNVKRYTSSSLSLCFPCLSAPCICQSVSGVRAEDTSVCLSLTITSLLSGTKEYLKSLGNSECSPQTFLENSGSLDKLLIIIQNEDIAAHVHKVGPPPVTHVFTVSPPICSSGDFSSS